SIRCIWFYVYCTLVVIVFFFQAEDGIRDLIVTGVQTCALPILSTTPKARRAGKTPCEFARFAKMSKTFMGVRVKALREQQGLTRSEERRVGKECRCRRSPGELRKKIEEQYEEDSDNE